MRVLRELEEMGVASEGTADHVEKRFARMLRGYDSSELSESPSRSDVENSANVEIAPDAEIAAADADDS